MIRFRQKTLTIVFALVFGGVIFSAARLFPLQSLPDTPRGFAALGVVAALYFFSHVLRAARIAVISTSLLGTSFRTVFSMNFFIAPWSLILPWKLDELIRLFELSNIGRSLARGVVVIVIDRTIDGAVLLAISLWVMSKSASHVSIISALAGIISVTVAIGFFAAPPMLLTIQRYIFTYHYKARAIRVLRAVDGIRRLSERSYDTITRLFLIISLCTFGIWTLEIASVAVFLAAIGSEPVGLITALEMLLSRLEVSWRVAWAYAHPAPLEMLSLIALFTLMAAWIPFAYYYALRRAAERRNASYFVRGQLF